MKNQRQYFIGIDLGGREKRTTGLCILSENGETEYETVQGKNVLKKIKPYLKNTKVITIDAPLTKGRGKGNFRLYEKFLSTKIFREEKASPLPPALMAKFCDFARDLKNKLEKKGFVLGINLIEVFPTLTKKLCGEPDGRILTTLGIVGIAPPGKTEDQKSALICAILAYLHANFRTRWLGYKDGFLFLPETSFWEKSWRQKFHRAWLERDRLKYKHLITNLFE